MAEEVGEGTGLRNCATEVIVLVGGDHVAGLIYVFRDVAVVVEYREVELTVTRHGKQTANAARALERTGEVEPPVVLDFRDVGAPAINCVDGLVNQVPVVIDECSYLQGFPFLRSCRRCGRRRDGGVKPLHDLRCSAMAVVVGVEDTDSGARRIELVVLRVLRRQQRLVL